MLNSGASLAQAMREVHMPIARLVVVVGTVALLLLAPFCATAQEKNHVTSEQVTRAIQELAQLAGDLLEDLGFTRAEILFRLRYQHPWSSFRSHYAYTNFGMTEGAVAAAKAYGLEWEEAAKKKLYSPLGMTSTSSRYAEFMARR